MPAALVRVSRTAAAGAMGLVSVEPTHRRPESATEPWPRSVLRPLVKGAGIPRWKLGMGDTLITRRAIAGMVVRP